MKGKVLQMHIVLDRGDCYSTYAVALGDFLQRGDYKFMIKSFFIENDNVHVKDINNFPFDLSEGVTKLIFPGELSLEELKDQIEYVTSIKYLPRLQSRVYEAFSLALKKAEPNDRLKLFPGLSVTKTLLKYVEFFQYH